MEPRTFKLRVGQSDDWCPEGTLVQTEAADLPELCERVGLQLGLLGVQVEIFDSDFDDWVGPFALDDVPAVASVRVRAAGRAPPPPAPEAAPAELAPAPPAAAPPAPAAEALDPAAAHQVERAAKKLRSLEQAYQIGALSQDKYLAARARLLLRRQQPAAAAAAPAARAPQQPALAVPPRPAADGAGRTTVRDRFSTAQQAQPPEPLQLEQPPAAAPPREERFDLRQPEREPDAVDEEDLTPEELAELAELYPQLIHGDGSPPEEEEPEQ